MRARFAAQIFSKIRECIEGRIGADVLAGEGNKTDHMLEGIHTHIGIGVYAVDTRLRYVEASHGGSDFNSSSEAGSYRWPLLDDVNTVFYLSGDFLAFLRSKYAWGCTFSIDPHTLIIGPAP